MNVIFSCPYCDCEVEADAELGGGMAQCPGCNETIMVPAAGIGEGSEIGGYRIETVRDQYPEFTTDAAGNWVAVWKSDDDLVGTISERYGVDLELLVRHFRSSVGTTGTGQRHRISRSAQHGRTRTGKGRRKN